MKDILRNLISDLVEYLTELASGFFNITLLLFDLLGIVLLFRVDAPWAQVVVLVIFVLSFGVTNFRIYRRQKRLLENQKDQNAMRVHCLQLIQGEINANRVSHWEYAELSDDAWQHYRDDIHWLPAEIRQQLWRHYRALDLLKSCAEDGLTTGWIEEAGMLCLGDRLPPDIQAWDRRFTNAAQSFSESIGQLPEALQQQIDLLDRDTRSQTRRQLKKQGSSMRLNRGKESRQ